VRTQSLRRQGRPGCPTPERRRGRGRRRPAGAVCRRRGWPRRTPRAPALSRCRACLCRWQRWMMLSHVRHLCCERVANSSCPGVR
jgi:hypothetical protein